MADSSSVMAGSSASSSRPPPVAPQHGHGNDADASATEAQYDFSVEIDDVAKEIEKQILDRDRKDAFTGFEAPSTGQPTLQQQTGEQRIHRTLDAFGELPSNGYALHDTIEDIYKNRVALIKIIKKYGWIELFAMDSESQVKSFRAKTSGSQRPPLMSEAKGDCVYGRWSVLPKTRKATDPPVPDGEDIFYGGISNDPPGRGGRHNSCALAFDPKTLQYAAEWQALRTIAALAFLIQNRRAFADDVLRFYGYVRSLDLDQDRLTRAFLHAIEPLFIGCNRGCRGHPRYQVILNKHQGTPRPGTVGVNTSTALIGPGSTIRAVGAKLPRVHGAAKATAKDFDRERAAYADAMLNQGVAVSMTSVPLHESRGNGDNITIYLPYWLLDVALPCIHPSAEVRRQLPPLPPKSTAILRLVRRTPTPNGVAPAVQGTPLIIQFFARHQLLLSINDGKGGLKTFPLDWTRGHMMALEAQRLVEMLAKYAGVAPVQDVRLPSAALGSTITLADIKPLADDAKRVEYITTVAGLAALLRRKALHPYVLGHTWQVHVTQMDNGQNRQAIPPPPPHLAEEKDLDVCLCFLPASLDVLVAYARAGQDPAASDWQLLLYQYRQPLIDRLFQARELTSQPPSLTGKIKIDRLIGPYGQPCVAHAATRSATLAGNTVGLPAAVCTAIGNALSASGEEEMIFRAKVNIKRGKLLYVVEGQEYEHLPPRGNNVVSKAQAIVTRCKEAVEAHKTASTSSTSPATGNDDSTDGSAGRELSLAVPSSSTSGGRLVAAPSHSSHRLVDAESSSASAMAGQTASSSSSVSAATNATKRERRKPTPLKLPSKEPSASVSSSAANVADKREDRVKKFTPLNVPTKEPSASSSSSAATVATTKRERRKPTPLKLPPKEPTASSSAWPFQPPRSPLVPPRKGANGSSSDGDGAEAPQGKRWREGL